MWYLDVNSAKTDFFFLSSHSILKLAPVLSQKSRKIHLVRTFCSSTAKTSTVNPIFYFMILIRTVLPVDEKKRHKSMFSFLAILLNCTDWAITGRIARVQFNSTLKRKIIKGALKGIFLVCMWINNAIKSNSVRYHMHHRKNLSFFSSFGLRAVFVKGSKIAVFLSIVTSKRALWPPLFITFFIIFWTCYISIPSFIYNLC